MTSLLGSFGGGASKKNVNNNANNATSTDPASSKLTAVAPANDNTPHYHFLHSMLLPSTVKIQKELRGRRFKDAQALLGEAVMGLYVFQYEVWPPEGSPVVLPLPDGALFGSTQVVQPPTTAAAADSATLTVSTSLAKNQQEADTDTAAEGDSNDDNPVDNAAAAAASSSASSPEAATTTAEAAAATTTSKALSLEEHFAQNNNDTEDATTNSITEDTESVMGDFSQAPSNDDLRPFDDVSTTTATTHSSATTTAASSTATLPVVPLAANNTSSNTGNHHHHHNHHNILEYLEDDPFTAMQMHKSVTDVLEAYVAVLMHPQKTNKACEDAMSCIKQLVVRGYVSGRAGGRDDTSGSGPAYRQSLANGNVNANGNDPSTLPSSSSSSTSASPPPPPSLLHRIMLALQKCSESNTESVQSQVVDTFNVILTSRQCSVHEASMLLAIRSIFHIYLVTKSDTIRKSAKTTLLDLVASMTLKMEHIATILETYHATALSTATTTTTTTPTSAGDNRTVHSSSTSTTSTSLYHTDTYYLLRSLVKLSSKELPGIDDKSTTPTNFLAQQFFTTTPVDPVALSNKVLSLELILTIMECAGDALCYGDKFVHLVQSQLCVTLLKNCMSNNSQVAYLSQKIFFVLVHKFKTHLRDEIQGFMTNIFLRVLRSDNASFEQKALVLESLRSVCQQPKLLTQIFLNYDCDFDAMNLYKDIVLYLTRLSAKSYSTPPPSNSNKKELEEHVELSLASVEVLVSILQALLEAQGMTPRNPQTNDTAGTRIRQLLNLTTVGYSNKEQQSRTLQSTLALLSTTTNTTTTTTTANNNNTIPSLTAVDTIETMTMSTTPTTTSTTTTTLDPTDVSTSNDDTTNQDGTAEENDSHNHNNNAMESRSDVAGRIVDAFDRKRNAEQNFELGIVKFTLNIKTGLNWFIDCGFCTLDAHSIAHFFLEHKDKLDKTQIGEVLGREPQAAFVKQDGVDKEHGGPGFFIRILHHYTEAMDFTGLPFDEAIRLFLSGFRLPGEAQKIDRIMEKFAERYTEQNEDVFPSADTAFILAFSVIMLNTDLHNPSIKPERRMTIESFIKNNKGIGANGSDLPKEFLTAIFNRIKERPFSLKEDDAAREKAHADAMQDSYFGGDGGGLLGFGLVGAPSTEERKREKFKKEREEMMTATEEVIRRKTRRAANYLERSTSRDIDPADVVKPMFDVTWGPVIGILSQVMELSNDERSIAVCLNGFAYSIRIAAHNEISLARNTFINSLTKFTLLGSIKEMKYKNIEAIQMLMTIAAEDGEYLGDSWGPVLQCISTLARMRNAASGLASDESFLEDSSTTAGTKSSSKQQSQNASKTAPARFGTPSKQKAEETQKETEDINQRAVLEAVSEQLIDKVFSSTVNLSAESLGHFMRQLVLVATAEIEGHTTRGITGVAPSTSGSSHGGGEDGPSIFCLHRLVEVADYNIDVRPRMVWTHVWQIMGDFFSKAGCHRNAMVSVFAIDSLKQLSSKFLEKPENSEFHFQRIFLRPFLVIIQNSGTRQDIRELILQCVDQIVSRMAHNLQSGWRIFFDIVMASAHDKSDRIVNLALNILQRMLDEHLDQLTRLSKVNPELSDPNDMAALEKRNRNSNAEDFAIMCQASLSFVQLSDSDAPRPLGVSMRALCHMAIYADLIADGRILPPVEGAQCDDPKAIMYTYQGLEEMEALEMVLWRPLLEGLANGIRSTSRNRVGGLGCLVQRGSVLAMRSILLRHGALFSRRQLEAILTQTLIPAITAAAESDNSPVVAITSESPAVTSLDFLAEPLPLPPPRYCRELLKFEEVARNVESAPSRPLGPAELLLEACFTDMRHGGDGDLTQAYKFAKKDMQHNPDGEQPFPDSWIATTAPIALGCLTDIVSEVIFAHGADGAIHLWPCIGALMQRWCNGEVKLVERERYTRSGWSPCEALVRIATAEIIRFSSRVAEALLTMESADSGVWARTYVTYISESLKQTLDVESDIKDRLLKDKIRAFKHARKQRGSIGSSSTGSDSSAAESSTSNPDADVENKEKAEASLEWVELVPILKIRCIAAHFLHQSWILTREDSIMTFMTDEMAKAMLEVLFRSRDMAEDSAKSEDLAHAFQEAILNDWGNDEMGEEALLTIARLAQTQGSPMFFLTQTAGATQALIKLLSALYEFKVVPAADNTWDREGFAAPHLLAIVKDVLTKFVESEAKESHRIDPNVWRNATESGVKVAVYCTSFASVVVGLLNAMLNFDSRHMALHGPDFFPMICRLIRVQSDEIRQLVQQILLEKFSPLLSASTAIE